jgi:hypothetical protein
VLCLSTMKIKLIVILLAGSVLNVGTVLAIDTVPLPEKPATKQKGTQAIGTWPTPEKPARNKRIRKQKRQCVGPRCPRRGRGTKKRPRPAPRR